jgi:hypothetical protein
MKAGAVQLVQRAAPGTLLTSACCIQPMARPTVPTRSSILAQLPLGPQLNDPVQGWPHARAGEPFSGANRAYLGNIG